MFGFLNSRFRIIRRNDFQKIPERLGLRRDADLHFRIRDPLDGAGIRADLFRIAVQRRNGDGFRSRDRQNERKRDPLAEAGHLAAFRRKEFRAFQCTQLDCILHFRLIIRTVGGSGIFHDARRGKQPSVFGSLSQRDRRPVKERFSGSQPRTIPEYERPAGNFLRKEFRLRRIGQKVRFAGFLAIPMDLARRRNEAGRH